MKINPAEPIEDPYELALGNSIKEAARLGQFQIKEEKSKPESVQYKVLHAVSAE